MRNGTTDLCITSAVLYQLSYLLRHTYSEIIREFFVLYNHSYYLFRPATAPQPELLQIYCTKRITYHLRGLNPWRRPCEDSVIATRPKLTRDVVCASWKLEYILLFFNGRHKNMCDKVFLMNQAAPPERDRSAMILNHFLCETKEKSYRVEPEMATKNFTTKPLVHTITMSTITSITLCCTTSAASPFNAKTHGY